MITGSFGTLAFLNPWVLAGLIFLPALWFLLRVTPPAPRLIIFPAARFLKDLVPTETTSRYTPWWILLLRLITLLLIIFALARPVLNPAQALPGQNSIRIIMDNDWASAQSWGLQTNEAQRLIDSAGRAKREIYILTTAPEPGSTAPAYYGPLTQARAKSVLRGLKPYPWPADYNAALKLIKENTYSKSLQTHWLSHGLQEDKTGNNKKFIQLLQNQGSLRYVRPDDAQLPILLRPNNKITSQMSIFLSVPKVLPKGTPVTVNALGADGRILDSQKITLESNKNQSKIIFDMPDSVRNRIQQIRLAGRSGAGAVLLLDDQFKRRNIAIMAPIGDSEEAPLTNESFYLERALAPYANISIGTIQTILEENPAVIILPNIGAIAASELNDLENWIKKGGLLLRFAGPNMTQGENFLVPVPLLKGGRALDGALTWNDPVKLAPFPETSPLYGLSVPDDIRVRRQLLAQPDSGMKNKTWAILEDGTPLITADNLGKGFIVLVHTTATPLWSDLSLSGLFVQILRRIVNLAGSPAPQNKTGAAGLLTPALVLNGAGAVTQPSGFERPIPSGNFDKTNISSMTPPGLYEGKGYKRSLNIGDRVSTLKTFADLPRGVEVTHYGGQNETKLMPFLLLSAFLLFLLDWALMAAMTWNWRRFRPVILSLGLGLGLGLALLILAPSAHAQSDQLMIRYADNIHLAYIQTGNPALDKIAYNGLEALIQTIKNRTSVEPSGVVAINPEQTELSFFPLIYWPVAQEQKPLSKRALQNIQYYIDHGGTILFDTRDMVSQTRGLGLYGQNKAMGGGRNADKLKALISGLNIPPLTPIKKDHVLTKSFYLLDSFSGRYKGGTIWVEEQSASGRDGVSSVIIGSHDWASAWAASSTKSGESGGSRGRSYTGGKPQQQEMALRFGVNLIMYALTGNYKADQVHLPHILERLGQ